MSRPRILAFDLATFAGVAWRDDFGSIITRAMDLREMAGIKKSQAAREHSKLFAALYRLIGDLMVDMELVGKIDVFSIEDDTGRNKATSALLAGYRAIVHLKAAHLGIRVVDDLDASQARKLAGVGGGSTPKEIAVASARRLYQLDGCEDEVDAGVLLIGTEQWLKAAPIREANETQKRRLKARIDRSLAKTGSRIAAGSTGTTTLRERRHRTVRPAPAAIPTGVKP